MEISNVQGYYSIPELPEQNYEKSQPINTPVQSQETNYASWAAASIGSFAAGAAAVALAKSGKLSGLTKMFSKNPPNAAPLQKHSMMHAQGVINTQKINQQIADVARNTTENASKRRAEDLAAAFGGKVEHVPQRSSITDTVVNAKNLQQNTQIQNQFTSTSANPNLTIA